MNTRKLAINGGTPARQPRTGPGGFGMTAIDEQEEAAVLEVMRAKRLYRFDGGEEESSTSKLEKDFAAFTDSQFSLAVNSGTAALILAYQGLGVGPGDEVIVPAYTWMSTASAAMALGAVPVIAEVDESLTLDPADVEAKITPYTKAIATVHMRGTPSRMDELLDVANRHGLPLLEDTAQAIGGSYKGRKLGAVGKVGCYSLQSSKVITAGEGGMLVTDDEQVWKRAYMFHDVPGGLRYNFPEEEIVWGVNFRIAEVLAAIAGVQLTRLDGLVGQLQARKNMLKSGMESVMQQKGMSFRDVPDPAGDTGSTLSFFATSPDKAQEMQAALNAENIGTSLLYHPNRPDYHVYSSWTGVMDKRTWTPNGGPWRWAQRELDYHPEMCPRSLELLGRTLSFNVDLNWTNEDVEDVLEGVTSVIGELG
ncbi:MAG: DegT/DnrJ/EryC1/StrS family aminotransferase [Chloroflexota bacterium]